MLAIVVMKVRIVIKRAVKSVMLRPQIVVAELPSIGPCPKIKCLLCMKILRLLVVKLPWDDHSKKT